MTEEQKRRRREAREKWIRENPEKAREAFRRGSAKWRAQNPQQVRESQRDYDLRSTYGISAEEYDRRLAGQGGICAICQKPPGRRRLDVDHDHRTGEIRGLLCPNCNNGLGRFLDSPDLLERAKKYLQKSA